MAATGNFKSYERGTRYQTDQAAFTAGMYYSDATIPESAARVLVNYDTDANSISIKPRKGLRTTHYNTSYNTASFPNAYSDTKLRLLASKVCYQNNIEYLQLIYGKYKTTTEYEVQVWTHQNAALKGICAVLYDSKNAATSEVPTAVVKADTTNILTESVGCFINDQYFFFNKATGTLCYTVFHNSKYILKELKAQETSYAQAQQMGFNMLLKDPYTYKDVYSGGESSMNFTSINAFDDVTCKKPAQQELIINQQYYYRISYAGAGFVRLVFDWTATDTMVWQELKTTTIEVTEDSLPKVVIPFRSSVPKAIIRCTAYAVTDDADTTGTPLDVIWFSFDYQATYTKPANEMITFSLATATTMTYWQNRLVVAGVKEDKAYLFMSAPELFEYFPFPSGADYLDEPIVAVQPILDNLLVFTKSKLYLYTLDPTIGLTRKCIQTNLNIDEKEVHLIQAVKNMVYFKSGRYYYMVVPKLNSATGELTIAPISRNVKELLDTEQYHSIIQEVYPDVELPIRYTGVHNYLDYESMHNVYLYKVEEGLYINFDLLYNTVKRVWSVYLYTSPAPITIYKADATKPGTMLSISYFVKTQSSDTNIAYEIYAPTPQIIAWNDTALSDKLCQAIIQPSLYPEYTPKDTPYNNRQYVDTGCIDITPNYKKRFREIQFRIVNNSGEALDFATTFYIDGVATTPKYEYVPIIDQKTGTLTLSEKLVGHAGGAAHIEGQTRLGLWNLGQDVFPDASIIKIRIPVSGKGYNAQIKISCNSQQDYTLLDVSNVYRILYSR